MDIELLPVDELSRYHSSIAFAVKNWQLKGNPGSTPVNAIAKTWSKDRNLDPKFETNPKSEIEAYAAVRSS